MVNKETDVVLSPVDDPFANVVRIQDRPRVNGYLAEDLRKAAAGSVWAQTVRVGRGNVVLFADDPAHRKYWLGTEAVADQRPVPLQLSDPRRATVTSVARIDLSIRAGCRFDALRQVDRPAAFRRAGGSYAHPVT